MDASLEARSAELLALFGSELRPFLEAQGVQGLDALDRQAEVLARALKRPDQVNIGFVGESQVGKSTLINALLERRALPSGGIGPLTARATRVNHGAEDRLTVAYHSKGALNRLVFALARNLQLRGDIGDVADPGQDLVPPTDGDEDELVVEEAVAGDGKPGGVSERAQQRAAYMFAQARRMLDAKPDVPELVLLDALLTVLERPPVGSAPATVPFLDRCAQLRDRLGKQESLSATDLGGKSAFQAELKLRAADWLSPLVAQLSLELAAPEVQGLNLVDLPGIGVSGDAAASEAQRFVETDGDALVLVFRNSGLTDAIADLLEKTGVITKLLFGGRDGHSPIQVILVVTHLDDVAKTQLATRAQEAIDNGSEPPDRHVLFRELAREMEAKVREQVAGALKRSKAFDDLEPSQRNSRQAVVDRLIDEMSVVCVAAPDYMEKRVGPDLGLAFLTDLHTTGIPRLREELHRLARTHTKRRERDVRQAHIALVETLDAHLSSLRKSMDEGGGARQAKWQKFCEELEAYAQPLRLEMQALHGDVAGVLRRGLLERIDALCGEAETRGLKRLRSLIRQGRDLHFQSLNAALRRDGIWERRDINFPNDLTFAVVDTIAAEWEPRIIESVRAEIRRLADRDLKLVEQLVQKARELDAKLVEETPIEEQKKILQQNSRSAVAWTKEQLEELRETVRARLRDAVVKPIEVACRQAIRAGRNAGTGAKTRILDVFEEAGGEALVEARKTAKRVLDDAYRKLVRKLDEGYFKDFHDPVRAALDTLTAATGERAKRGDAGQRKKLVQSVAQHRAALAALQVDAAEEADAA